MPALNNECYLDEEEFDELNFKLNESLTIECICPKCGTIHRMKLLWSGRGIPKKYCQPCKTFVSTIEPAELCSVPQNVNRGIEKEF